MPENIGNFKVVLEGEVSPKLGKNLEKELGKSSEKAGDKLKKELEKGVSQTSFGKLLKDAENFARKFSDIRNSSPIKESTSSSGGATETGAAAGGPKGAMIGALVDLAMKLSVIVIAIKMIYDAIMSLAPIQAILKMVTAILQLTLYPIAQFFLVIFKPIIAILLKYLILPFYYIVMPALQKLGAWLGGLMGEGFDMAKGVVDWLFTTFLTPLYEVLVALFGFVTTIFNSIVSIVSAALKVVFDLLINLGNFLITSWTAVFKSIYSLFVFYAKVITALGTLLFGPLIEAMSLAISGDLSGAVGKLVSWVTGAGSRFDSFVGTMSGAWNELISNISSNASSIIDAGVNVFQVLAADIGNFAMVTVESVKNIFNSIVDLAETMTESSKAILLGLANGVIGIFMGLGESVTGILKLLSIEVNFDFKAIANDFTKMIEGLDTSQFDKIKSAFSDMIDKMLEAFKKVFVPEPTPEPTPAPSPWSGDSSGRPPVNPYSDGWSGEYSDGYTGWSGDSGRPPMNPSGPLKPMARGGIVMNPTNALIGESGPEAIIPLPGFLKGNGLGELGSTSPFSTNVKGGMGGNTVNVNFYNTRVEKDVDIDDIVEKIERSFYTNSRRVGIR